MMDDIVDLIGGSGAEVEVEIGGNGGGVEKKHKLYFLESK